MVSQHTSITVFQLEAVALRPYIIYLPINSCRCACMKENAVWGRPGPFPRLDEWRDLRYNGSRYNGRRLTSRTRSRLTLASVPFLGRYLP